MEINRNRDPGRNRKHRVSCRNLAGWPLLNQEWPRFVSEAGIRIVISQALLVHLEETRGPGQDLEEAVRHQGLQVLSTTHLKVFHCSRNISVAPPSSLLAQFQDPTICSHNPLEPHSPALIFYKSLII